MTAEWHNVTTRFTGFIRDLQPKPPERRRALGAARDVAGWLGRWLDAAGVPAAGGHMVIGGHAKGTALAPGDKVDLLFMLPAAARAKARPGAGPTVAPGLGSELAALLRARYAAVHEADEGWLGVLAGGNETEPGVAVRTIPSFACANGTYLVAGAGAGWRHLNPAAEEAALRRANEASAKKATHLILMLKAWRRAHGITLAPLALDLLVGEFVSVWTYQRRGLLFYDWMVRDFFFWMRHQADRSLAIPGTIEAVDVGHGWIARAEEAYAHAEEASRLERDNRSEQAVVCWRAIFGPAFAAPQIPEKNEPAWLTAPPAGTQSGTEERRAP